LRMGAGNGACLEIDTADGGTLVVRVQQPGRRG
jgi:hypothetical protein